MYNILRVMLKNMLHNLNKLLNYHPVSLSRQTTCSSAHGILTNMSTIELLQAGSETSIAAIIFQQLGGDYTLFADYHHRHIHLPRRSSVGTGSDVDHHDPSFRRRSSAEH